MQHHYKQEVSHIEECTYTHGRLTLPPPPTEHRSLQHHYTQEVSHIEEYTYTYGRLTLPLLQMSIDLFKTITPNKFHI